MSLRKFVTDANTVLLFDLETNTTDGSGNSNTGTLVGTATITSSGVTLDGNSDYVECEDSSSLDLTGAFAIEAWINKDVNNNYAGIVYKGTSYSFLQLSTSERLVISMAGSDRLSSTNDAAGKLVTGTWYWCAAVYSGSTLKIYINGKENISTAYSTNPVANTAKLQVGAIPAATWFDGTIASVRISNADRSAAQLVTSYLHFVPDTTNNNTATAMDIPFNEDATWRAAVTALKVDGNTLTDSTDYTISSGNVQLKPAGGNANLTTPGTKSVTIEATGYGVASFTQVIVSAAFPRSYGIIF